MPDDQSPQPGEATRARRRQLATLLLTIVVGCCGALVWSRIIWESRDLDNVVVRESARTLRSHDRAERISAARDLGRFGSAAREVAVPALIAGMKDSDADVRGAAAEGLGRMVVDPIDALAAARVLNDLLSDGQPVVRIAAASALATLGSAKRSAGRPSLDPRLALAALGALVGDSDVVVRSAALRGLALVGPGAAAAPPATLVAALDDPSDDNRVAAAAAITSFKQGVDPFVSPIFRSLEHAEPRCRMQYLSALHQLRPPAITAAIIPTLTAALDRPDREVRCGAIFLLGRLGPDAGPVIPALIKALTDSIDLGPVNSNLEDPTCRAAWALGEIAPGTGRATEAIAALTNVLPRVHPTRRGTVAFALGEFSGGAEVAIPALIDMLRQNSAPDTAAFALGRIAPGTALAGEAVAALTVALDAKSPFTRLAAIESLRRFGAGAAPARPGLRKMANDPDRQIGAAAAAALVELATAAGDR